MTDIIYKDTEKPEVFAAYLAAAEAGDAVAKYNTGLSYFDGKNVAQDYAQAARWLLAALADKTGLEERWGKDGFGRFYFANLYERIGYMYATGNGLEQNIPEAEKFCLEAANTYGSTLACTRLGIIHKNTGNREEALRWFEKAATRGDSRAAVNLGDLLSDKNHTPDYTAAAKWYRQAVRTHSHTAQYRLGLLYHEGHGVKQNDAKAASLWHKSAVAGNDLAQFYLGTLYEAGAGVGQSIPQAMKWYAKSADLGFCVAQHYLAVLLESGKGLNGKDIKSALFWYGRAAAQDYKPAVEALARLSSN